MTGVALLSHPRASGNHMSLPAVRALCARHADVFHYEVEHDGQIAAALRTIALVRPKLLVINGDDRAVQETLSELCRGGHFGERPPPVAVLPSDPSNLIARDLGAQGCPVAALARMLALARTDMRTHIISRRLISLTGGRDGDRRPVFGMFLGGGGLAETILHCRHNIYPLGLPHRAAHALAVLRGLAAILVGGGRRRPTADRPPLSVSVGGGGAISGAHPFLAVTTLEHVLRRGAGPATGAPAGALQMLVIERSLGAALRALFATVRGRIDAGSIRGVHFMRGDEIRIGGGCASVLLDGVLFEGHEDRPILLRPSGPIPFLRLAA